jgi:hypothetical protein
LPFYFPATDAMFSRPFTYLPARPNARWQDPKAGASPLEEHFVTINLDEGYEGLAARPEPGQKGGPVGEWVKHCADSHGFYARQVGLLTGVYRLCRSGRHRHVPVCAHGPGVCIKLKFYPQHQLLSFTISRPFTHNHPRLADKRTQR